MAMDEFQRGAEAAMILDHPLVKEALKGFRLGLDAQRAKAGIRDQELHTRLIMLEQCFNAFEQAFKTTIETGKLAHIKLQQDSKFRVFQR
jgi:hypothetical protein